MNELPGLVRVVRDKSVRTAFVCLQGRRAGRTGAAGATLDSWLAGHLLSQGTIATLPKTEERTNQNLSITQSHNFVGMKFCRKSSIFSWLLLER